MAKFRRSSSNIDSNFTEFLPKKGNTILNNIQFLFYLIKTKLSIYYHLVTLNPASHLPLYRKDMHASSSRLGIPCV